MPNCPLIYANRFITDVFTASPLNCPENLSSGWVYYSSWKPLFWLGILLLLKTSLLVVYTTSPENLSSGCVYYSSWKPLFWLGILLLLKTSLLVGYPTPTENLSSGWVYYSSWKPLFWLCILLLGRWLLADSNKQTETKILISNLYLIRQSFKGIIVKRALSSLNVGSLWGHLRLKIHFPQHVHNQSAKICIQGYLRILWIRI